MSTGIEQSQSNDSPHCRVRLFLHLFSANHTALLFTFSKILIKATCLGRTPVAIKSYIAPCLKLFDMFEHLLQSSIVSNYCHQGPEIEGFRAEDVSSLGDPSTVIRKRFAGNISEQPPQII